MSRSVLVIAGEHSGDMHLAPVIRAVKAQDPSIRFWGIAGDLCQAEGVDLEVHANEMAVLGLVEVLRRYRFFKRVFGRLLDQAKTRRPDAVLLVDYPGFNLRFAREAHALGLKTIYYICPQVWAWRRSRIYKMAEILDRLMVIFPFEEDVFKETSLKVNFIGHPLVEVAEKVLASPVREMPWPGSKHVALLPGSRRQEIERILPDLLAAAARLEQRDAETGFIIAAASDGIVPVIEQVMAQCPEKPEQIGMVVNDTREVLRQARAAWVASGTATIETALMRCPMVVTYKTSPMTYAIGRRLVRLPHIGMVNIVAGREICPELIQHHATPDALADALQPLLSETDQRTRMLANLEEISRNLGGKNAYEQAAVILQEELFAAKE